MDSVVLWLLGNIISPLLLPLFVVASLCMLAGVKPEPIVGGCISVFGSVLTGAFRLLETLIKALFSLGKQHTPKPKQ